MASTKKVFVGWNKPFDNITTNLNITAKYKNKTFTVSFVDSDGTLLSKQSVIADGYAENPITNPTQRGKSFQYWTLDSVSASVETVAISANTEFVASYTDRTFKVTYDVLDIKTVYIGYTTNDNIPLFSGSTAQEKLTFSGWTCNIPNVEPGDKMPCADVVFTAQYKEKICKVVFLVVSEIEGESSYIVSTQYIPYGGSARLPFIVGDSTHTFSGWNGDVSYITNDITITNIKSLVETE